MKKLMKKKVSILGKSVSVFAIVMVAMIGLAAAALVPYLSGTLTGSVGVTSPLIFEGVFDGTNTFGVIEQTFTLNNTATVNISAVVDFEISTTGTLCNGTNGCDAGGEFALFLLGNIVPDVYCTGNNDEYTTDDNMPEGLIMCYWDMIDNMKVGTDGKILFRYGELDDDGTLIPPTTDASNMMTGNIILQFKPNAEPATYTFRAAAVDPSSDIGTGFT